MVWVGEGCKEGPLFVSVKSSATAGRSLTEGPTRSICDPPDKCFPSFCWEMETTAPRSHGDPRICFSPSSWVEFPQDTWESVWGGQNREKKEQKKGKKVVERGIGVCKLRDKYNDM